MMTGAWLLSPLVLVLVNAQVIACVFPLSSRVAAQTLDRFRKENSTDALQHYNVDAVIARVGQLVEGCVSDDVG